MQTKRNIVKAKKELMRKYIAVQQKIKSLQFSNQSSRRKANQTNTIQCFNLTDEYDVDVTLPNAKTRNQQYPHHMMSWNKSSKARSPNTLIKCSSPFNQKREVIDSTRRDFTPKVKFHKHHLAIVEREKTSRIKTRPFSMSPINILNMKSKGQSSGQKNLKVNNLFEAPAVENLKMMYKLEEKLRETREARFKGFISPFKLRKVVDFERITSQINSPHNNQTVKMKLKIESEELINTMDNKSYEKIRDSQIFRLFKHHKAQL